MIQSADFSTCGKYRYLLTRIWDEAGPMAMCIGLNPSNANAEKNDPTIRLLIDRLDYLGYGGLRMVNLYAYISSKPKALFEVPDALGDNDLWISNAAANVGDVIFCWGDFKNISFRAKQMINQFPDAYCFGKSKSGAPIHPMALMYGGVKRNETSLTKFIL